MADAPDWFFDAINAGLQALVVLHLPGGPGHETVAYTRDVWVGALWDAPVEWQENVDSRRIEIAFRRLARQADRWPTPRTLMELMPPRPQPPALPGPQLTADQKRRNSERLRRALQEAMNQ